MKQVPGRLLSCQGYGVAIEKDAHLRRVHRATAIVCVRIRRLDPRQQTRLGNSLVLPVEKLRPAASAASFSNLAGIGAILCQYALRFILQFH
jgi:hypothetical protein